MGFWRVGRTTAYKVISLDALTREASTRCGAGAETVPDFKVVPCNGTERQAAGETKEHGIQTCAGQP